MTATTHLIFRLFDGGHCYLWAVRLPNGYIELKRWPNRVKPSDVKKFAQWVNQEEECKGQ